MRRTWDALAGGDTAVFVGDPATGVSELAGLFGRLGADPRGGVCVEVGCGPGRMTGALAERFDRVVALDVSPAMLEQARAHVTATTSSNRSASAPVIRPGPQPTSTQRPPRGSAPSRPNSPASSSVPLVGSPTYTAVSPAARASHVRRISKLARG